MDTAFRLRERLPERERCAVEGAYYVPRDRPKAIAAFERAVAIDSFNVDALNSLALLYTGTRDYARAERLYRRAMFVEPENGVILSNLAGTLVSAGKLADVDSILRVAKERKIPYPMSRREADLLYTRGQFDSVEALARVAMRSSNVANAQGSADFVRSVAMMRGRLRESESLNAELREQAMARGEPPNPIGQVIRAAFLDAWFRENPKVAVARLDSATRASSLMGPSSSEVNLELARIYAVAGAPDRARTLVKEANAALTDSAARRRTQSRRMEIEGEIALAERRTEDAIQSFRRSDVAGDGLPQRCQFCLPALLGRAYDQANNADSTIANLERYIASPGADRISIDQWFLAAAYKRLGELYEARGDAARAITNYNAFVTLWQRADPDLQPKVAEVRARAERLRRTLPQ